MASFPRTSGAEGPVVGPAPEDPITSFCASIRERQSSGRCRFLPLMIMIVLHEIGGRCCCQQELVFYVVMSSERIGFDNRGKTKTGQR